MLICPNLSNPDVAREFNELKDAIGEKAAYAVWSLNNGNAIDKAPNGEPSILFQLLSDIFGRQKAISIKSKLYGYTFKDLFGEWFEKSMIHTVDANGEPLISCIIDHNGNRKHCPYNTTIASKFKFLDNLATRRRGSDDFIILKLNANKTPHYYVLLPKRIDNRVEAKQFVINWLDEFLDSVGGNIHDFGVYNIEEINGRLRVGIFPKVVFEKNPEDLIYETENIVHSIEQGNLVKNKNSRYAFNHTNKWTDEEIYYAVHGEEPQVRVLLKDGTWAYEDDVDSDLIMPLNKEAELFEDFVDKLFGVLAPPKRINKLYGSNVREHLFHKLKPVFGPEISYDILNILDNADTRELAEHKLYEYFNGPIITVLLERISDLQQLIKSRSIISSSLPIKVAALLRDGKVTGNADVDIKLIGEKETFVAQEMFPAIYNKGYTPQRAGYYRKDIDKIVSGERERINSNNKFVLGTISHLKKLTGLLAASLYNLSFYKKATNYIVQQISLYSDKRYKDSAQTSSAFTIDNTTLKFIFNKIFPDSSKTYSLKSTLAKIKDYDSRNTRLINKILENLKGDANIKIKFSDNSTMGSTWAHKNLVTIVINKKYSDDNVIYTILHEAVHAVSIAALDDNPEWNQEVQKYVDYVNAYNRSHGNEKWYGLKNSYEFIAEYFSNPEFLQFLKSVPAMDNLQYLSLFHQILIGILRLFGVYKNTNAYVLIAPVMERIIDYTLSNYTMEDIIDDSGISSSLLNGYSTYNLQALPLQQSNTIIQDTYNLRESVERQRNSWISLQIALYKLLFGKDMDASLLNLLRSTYDKTQLTLTIRTALSQIASKFGATLSNDGYYLVTGTKMNDKLVEYVLNALDDDTMKSYRLHQTAKYLAVDGIQHKGTVANVIAAAIRGDANISLETFDEAIARDFIRAFWYSDLVQSALDVMNDTGNRTSQELEDMLVKLVVKLDWRDLTRQSRLKDVIRNFWSNLTKLFKQVFNPHNWSLQQKLDIIDALLAAILYQDDLEVSLNVLPVYAMVSEEYKSGLSVTKSDKDVLEQIKTGTKTRLKAAFARKTRNQDLINRLRSELEILDTKDSNELSDIIDVIYTFLDRANIELGEVAEYMYGSPVRTRSDGSTYVKYKGLLKTPIDQWDALTINLMNTNLLGFYNDLLSLIHTVSTDNNSALHELNNYLVSRASATSGTIDIEKMSDSLLTKISSLRTDYITRIIKPMAWNYLDKYIDKQDWLLDKEGFRKRAKQYFDLEQLFGDLGISEEWIGFATRSRSPIVRLVLDVISNTLAEVHRVTLRKGLELIRAYNLLVPFGSQMSVYNFQKQFLELDRNGIPTGYFVRRVNEGLFFIDKDAEEEKIRNEINKTLSPDLLLTVDEDGNTVFPQEPDETADNSIYNRYMDKLDEWLDKHCERRYKLEYYKAKRRYLHRDTILRQSLIQREIDVYLLKAKLDNGLYDFYNKLTGLERRRLKKLQDLKRNLGEYYYFDFDSNGNILVTLKVGSDLRVAEEINAWNNFLRKHLKWKPDWDKLNKQLDLISDPAEKLRFYNENTCELLTQEFYDILSSGGKQFDDELLRKLKARHSEIVRHLKGAEGYVQPNLVQYMSTGLNGDLDLWKELHRLESEMAKRRDYLIQNGKFIDKGPSAFKQIALMYSVDGPYTGLNYWTWLYGQWANAFANNQNLRQVFFNTFYYKNEKGLMRPLDVFLYLGPVDRKKYVETVPISIYRSLDDTSDFKNNDYDETNPKSMQAKDSVYHNDAYDKFDPTSSKYDKKSADFLQLLRDTMDEANSVIPQKALYRIDLLPQMTGRTASVLARSLSVGDLFKNLKYSVWDLNMSEKYAMNNGDTDVNVDLPRRPDGSVVQNIPIRFVRKLPNMKLLTNDVVGSIIMYYQMAMNYGYKSENLPYLDSVLQSIDPNNSSNKKNKLQRLYNVVKNKLDQQYYGHEITSTRIDLKDNKSVGAILKGKVIRKLATIAMLGGNFTTMEVGYIDAMMQVISDAFGGKYLTNRDLAFGIWNTLKHIPGMIGNVGKQTSDDWLIAAMQYNGLSKSNSEIFGNTDQSKAARIFNNYFVMGGYTLLDYMANSIVLSSIYHHYRLVKNPESNKDQFMTLSLIKTKYRKLGYTEKQAEKIWVNAKYTLADAYFVKNGVFTVKQQFLNVVTYELENLLYKLLHDRTAMYNGVIPLAEKAKLSLNVWGSYVLLMRGFLVNTYWDRFQTGVDYADEKEGLPSAFSEYRRDDQGYEDFATGQYQGAVFKDFVRGLYKLFRAGKSLTFESGNNRNLLTSNLWYAVKRCLIELAILGAAIAFMLHSLSAARTQTPPDDDENIWSINIIDPVDKNGNRMHKPFLEFNFDHAYDKFINFLRWKAALVGTRVVNERFTPWWPGTVMDLIKSPTTANSWFDLIGSFVDIIKDLIDGRYREEVKRGGYKHMSRGTKDLLLLFSALTVNNIVKQWHTEGIKSTLNYYLGVSPIDFIAPSASKFKKEQEESRSYNNDLPDIPVPDVSDIPDVPTPDVPEM